MGDRVLISYRANDDLSEIWEYVADESEDRADAFIEAVREQFQMIADNPMIGRDRGNELQPGIRSLPWKRYVIFYRPIEGGIKVMRILHGRMDVYAMPLD